MRINLSNKHKNWILNAVAMIVSVVPPALAILERFPLWKKDAGVEVYSGTAILLGFAVLIPLIRFFWHKIKTPATWVIWLIVWIASWALSQVIDSLVIIAMFGAISNFIGMLLFLWAKKYKGRVENE